LLIEFAEAPNTTIVLVAHSIDNAVFLSDRVIVLGGSPLQLRAEFPVKLSRPRHRENAEIFELALRIKAVLRTAAGQDGDSLKDSNRLSA
jgi:ABC-type nitrate/sulfonate/bicarbonate transport system ATPase subunit